MTTAETAMTMARVTMTDAPAKPKPINRGWWITGRTALATFLALTAGLGWQMYRGHDPMLGSSTVAEPLTQKRALIIRRRVIEVPAPEAQSQQQSYAQTPAYSAPQQSQIPAAPAPAPAVPTTRSS